MPTLSGTPPLSAEQMAELREDSLAMQVILTGAMDSRIAELKTLQADITVKQEALIALDDANQVRAQADAYAAMVKANSDSLFSQANSAVQAAQVRSDQVASQQAVIDAAKAVLAQAQADFAAYQQDTKDALQAAQDKADAHFAAMQADIDLQAKVLTDGQERLIVAQKQLLSDQAAAADLKSKLTAKLEAFASV